MAGTVNNLDKKQKLALGGLAFFGVLLIAIWFLKINSEIRGPLSDNLARVNSASSTALTAEEQLKNQDTDGDGLSDWDELNIYHTSPYLADSDSDGIPDGVEVANGTDPNCPQGKDCGNIAPIVATGTSAIGAIGGDTSGAGSNLASSSSTDLVNMLSGASDAASLRKLLIQSGMDKAELDQISDADLMKNYQTLLASTTKGQ